MIDDPHPASDLALRFVEMTARQWLAKGLPAEALADALTSYGLSMTAKFSSPADTAEALREWAIAVEGLAPEQHTGGSC